MEIEEENFQGEVSKTAQSYFNLLMSNNITPEVIFEEFAELFSCEVYIKNGLISKVNKTRNFETIDLLGLEEDFPIYLG